MHRIGVRFAPVVGYIESLANLIFVLDIPRQIARDYLASAAHFSHSVFKNRKFTHRYLPKRQFVRRAYP